jgi:rhodanese-related sulfurtransferase
MMKHYLFLILLLPLIIFIFLALPGKKSFRLSGENTLELIKGRTHIISVNKYKEMHAVDSSIQLVDLRSEAEFSDRHLPEALSLPVQYLNANEIHQFFKGKNPTRVLYAGETYYSEKYWILLTQMGIENLFVLETGPMLDSLIRNWDSDRNRMIIMDEIPGFTFQPDTTISF